MAEQPGDIYKRFVLEFPIPTDGSMRVWWIPQIPGKPFEWPVAGPNHAIDILNALAAYDDFQFAENVKGDYANMGGLIVFRNGEWEDWESENGESINEYRRNRS